jgi:hypothetical protein
MKELAGGNAPYAVFAEENSFPVGLKLLPAAGQLVQRDPPDTGNVISDHLRQSPNVHQQGRILFAQTTLQVRGGDVGPAAA